MPVPCGCCPVDITGCHVGTVELVLNGAHTEIFTGGPGIVPIGGPASVVGLARWSDGDISGANFTGYTSPGVQFTAITSPIIDLSFTSARNRVIGVREWNQGGGDLGDADGFASWDYEVFAGVVSLVTGNMVMGNGGAPFTHLFPGGQLNGVTRIRLSNMRKLNPGAGVAPLVREVRLLATVPVWPCRVGTVMRWYDADGNEAPAATVTAC